MYAMSASYVDVQSTRKAAVAELFIMYLIYLAVNLYAVFKNPQTCNSFYLIY
jgi:hypothetical protein